MNESRQDAPSNQEVHTLVILGGNPVFDAPANLGFAAALTNVPFSVHLAQHNDETSARCGWLRCSIAPPDGLRGFPLP